MVNQIGRSGVQVKKGNEKFTVVRSRSPQNLKCGHFTLLFCRGRQRNVTKCKTHVQSVFFFLIKPIVLRRCRCRRRRRCLSSLTWLALRAHLAVASARLKARSLYQNWLFKSLWSSPVRILCFFPSPFLLSLFIAPPCPPWLRLLPMLVQPHPPPPKVVYVCINKRVYLGSFRRANKGRSVYETAIENSSLMVYP